MIAHCMDDLAKVNENCLYDIMLRIDGKFCWVRGVFLDIDIDNMTAEFRPVGSEDVMNLTLDNIWKVTGAD